MVALDGVLKLPEWYVNERKTEKIIDKLATMKELDYYLNNPDEFIRRQAIIKLSSLKLKDSENKLREILDDPLESNDNKNLAAWALNAVYLKLKTEILINNRYLSRFTGKETLNELYPVTYEDNQQSISFNFSSNPECLQLPTAQDELLGIRNSGFDSAFNLNLWLSAFMVNFVRLFKVGLFDIAKIFINSLKSIICKLFTSLSGFIKYSAGNLFKKKPGIENSGNVATITPELKKAPQIREQYMGSSQVYYRGKNREVYGNNDLDTLVIKTRSEKHNNFHLGLIASTASFFKKVVFNLLYLLFSPIRIFLKHKLVILCIIGGFYIFFGFTSPGKILFNSYFGKDLNEIQSDTVNFIKQSSLNVWEKFMSFSSLDKVINKTSDKKDAATKSIHTSKALFSVTASKGLNIRKEPNASSEKISGGSLKYGSIVTYLGRESKDSSGRAWYYIKAADGRTGWVSTKYLKKKDG